MGNHGWSAHEQLTQMSGEIRAKYRENRRLLSFPEYLQVVAERPYEQLRSAPQYLKDTLDFFGTTEVQYPWGNQRRFRLFDCEWADGRDKLVGHEEVQNQVYRALEKFVHEGTSNKLIFLHGPNGSAKSTLVRAIGRGLQHYSGLDEGALYRINWVFPTQRTTQGGIGFGGKSQAENTISTFAHLPDELIDAKLADELRDHPFLLIPPETRQKLIDDLLISKAKTDDDFAVADYLRYGRLSHKNRSIYEALLASYQGEYQKVLRHVQVERFYIQHRYRSSYVTVEPQLSVDATERQITVDRSVSALPTALQSVSLYEYGGELVGANRGLIEYSDLLKRPLEAYKYLIATVERASVNLPNATVFLDLVFIGTSNEIHLEAFKQIPEFQSFKGRLELIRVPYLRDFRQEQEIYQQRVQEAAGTKHVAPHTAYVAALWAVLTRMRKPQPDRYSAEVSETIAKLSPVEKAELYALGTPLGGGASAKSKLLTATLMQLRSESDTQPVYEGRVGASPRDLLGVLYNAANSNQYTYLSPFAILDEIEHLITQPSVYEFLREDSQPGGFHDHAGLLKQAKERLLERLDADIQNALGLVTEQEYERVFLRYVTHVMHWTKKEKVQNPSTGVPEDPDEGMMQNIEGILDVGSDPKEFRHDLISKIGAWSLDHPRERPTYTVIFSDYYRRLKEAYFEDRRKTVTKELHELLTFLSDGVDALDKEASKRAANTRDRLIDRCGYADESIRDTVSALLRHRYSA